MQKTTFFGMLSAGMLAMSHVPGMPQWLVLASQAISVFALACLGYHAQDCPKDCPNRKSSAGVVACMAALLVIVTVTLGCRVGGLGLDVKSNTFGSLKLDLDGGVIGKGALPKPVTPSK
jgi:hypothetical protein